MKTKVRKSKLVTTPLRSEGKMSARGGAKSAAPKRGRSTKVTSPTNPQSEITEGMQAEEALRENGKRFVSIYDTVGDVIFQLAVEKKGCYRFTSVNRAFLATTGLTSAQVIGKLVNEVIPEPSLSVVLEKYAAAVRGKEIVRWEETSEYPTGRLIGEVSIAPTFDEAGKCTHLVGAVHDITAHKRAEEQLVASESRYRGLFEDSPVSLWEEDFSAVKQRLEALRAAGITDFQEYFTSHPEVVTECEALIKVLDVNKATVGLFGANRKEDILTGLAKILEGQPTQVFQDELVNIAAGKTRFGWEGINSTLDGRLRNIEVGWSIAPGFENSLSKVLISVIDITERKKAEQALAWEQYLLGTLLDNLPDHIYFKDRDGHFTRISRSQAEAFGLSDSAGALGKTDADFFTEVHARSALEAEQNIITTGQPLVGLEEEETWPDGRLNWVYTTKMPLQDQAGNIIGTFGISSDITERKRAEDALRKSEAELRALFASMHDVVLVIDHDGVYRKIAPTNPELLVKPSEELLGRNLRDVFPPEQAETFIRTMQQVLDTKQTAQVEYDLIIGDQTVRFGTSISPMTEDSTLWVAHDITRSKRIELVQNVIFRITQAAITSEGIDALYRSIHSILGELIPAENFYIALYDPVKRLISFPYYIDQYDEPPTGMTDVQGLTGYVIRTGRPLLATREIYDRLVQQGEVEPLGTAGVDWMGAPLKVEGHMIGVMVVQSYTAGIHFDHEDLNLLEFVSTQVAQAIERKRMEEEIRNLALTDELTGFYNRRGFTLLAEQEMKVANRQKRNMLLIFCDVDDLKAINDRHGHAQGDLALKEVSAILKETFREADIPGRIGGDEFVVLAADASLETVDDLKNRIQAKLERRNQQGDRLYPLTFSIGIARYDPEAPCTVSELITQADSLMYQQKQERKRKNRSG